MRKSQFNDEQIVAILRESDRTSVVEAAKKHKVSEQTIYVWRKHFAGLASADVKRLKALELEDAKLKRLLAERDLEVDIMREVNRKNGEPTGTSRADPLRSRPGSVATASLRAAGNSAFDHGLPVAPPDKDAPALIAMRRLSSQYPRYGYRRIRIFLRREGLPMGINRARRLWRQAGLGLPRKRPRRRIAASRPRPLPSRFPSNAGHSQVHDTGRDARHARRGTREGAR